MRRHFRALSGASIACVLALAACGAPLEPQRAAGTGPAATNPGHIRHVVVLMMENRSFDHLVGFLDHDNPDYPRLDRLDVSCPRYPWLPFGPRVRPTPDALAVLGTDPDHSHEAVLDQLYTRAGKPTMTGFIDSFAYKIKHGTRRRMSWWQRAFARLTSLLTGLFRRRPSIPAKAGEINHVNLLRAVRAAGYKGKIGLEFMPLDQNDAKAVDDMLALGVA